MNLIRGGLFQSASRNWCNLKFLMMRRKTRFHCWTTYFWNRRLRHQPRHQPRNQPRRFERRQSHWLTAERPQPLLMERWHLAAVLGLLSVWHSALLLCLRLEQLVLRAIWSDVSWWWFMLVFPKRFWDAFWMQWCGELRLLRRILLFLH